MLAKNCFQARPIKLIIILRVQLDLHVVTSSVAARPLTLLRQRRTQAFLSTTDYIGLRSIDSYAFWTAVLVF